MKKINHPAGTTFIELLLYMAIFLVITPILISVSINAMRLNNQHSVEKKVNADSQFLIERIYDLVSQAKSVDLANTVLDNPNGKVRLVMQDNSTVDIRLNATSHKVEIVEGGVSSNLSSDDSRVQNLYFEKITDQLNHPNIVLSMNVHLDVMGNQTAPQTQKYVISANLTRGDYDNDGTPDYLDQFPEHPECTEDSDNDGVCDELDNCVLTDNPFQEDCDGDGIGDSCDSFNDPAMGCSLSDVCLVKTDQALINLINKQPPVRSSVLRKTLLNSSPLSEATLNAVIARNPRMDSSDFVRVFIKNTVLPAGMLARIQAMNPPLSRHGYDRIAEANDNCTSSSHHRFHSQKWCVSRGAPINSNEVTYLVNRDNNNDHNHNNVNLNQIKFSDATVDLGINGAKEADIFVVTENGATGTVTVTTNPQQSNHNGTSTLVGQGAQALDSNGFLVKLSSIAGNTYTFMVMSQTNTKPLEYVLFDFGGSTTISAPVNTYTTYRYNQSCSGGCDVDCGDVGSGVASGNIITDNCYDSVGNFPEWCSRWNTNLDDGSANFGYMGGTQTGEKTLYWEKEFKSVLSSTQTANVTSILVAGQLAYQSTVQFFCDDFSSSCPMNGALQASQPVQLYNFQTSAWETTGNLNLDGTTSAAQNFEILYNGANPQKYISPAGLIRARMQFHWNGQPPSGQTSAPAFMLIDYFVVHLKW